MRKLPLLLLALVLGSATLFDGTIFHLEAPLDGQTFQSAVPVKLSTPGSGTGISNCVDEGGAMTCTVGRLQFVANATTADFTVATLPVNTRVREVDASLTTTFACTGTCTTSTLSMVLGKGAGGAEYLASFDADAAIAWFGDADAEMGSLMTRAAASQSGTFSAAAQAVVLRLTSGTGNIGNGSATNLSQGSVTIYVKFDAIQ
jgi:hypothetical protein